MNKEREEIIKSHVRNSKTVTAGCKSAAEAINNLYGAKTTANKVNNHYYNVMRPKYRELGKEHTIMPKSLSYLQKDTSIEPNKTISSNNLLEEKVNELIIETIKELSSKEKIKILQYLLDIKEPV